MRYYAKTCYQKRIWWIFCMLIMSPQKVSFPNCESCLENDVPRLELKLKIVRRYLLYWLVISMLEVICDAKEGILAKAEYTYTLYYTVNFYTTWVTTQKSSMNYKYISIFYFKFCVSLYRCSGSLEGMFIWNMQSFLHKLSVQSYVTVFIYAKKLIY